MVSSASVPFNQQWASTWPALQSIVHGICLFRSLNVTTHSLYFTSPLWCDMATACNVIHWTKREKHPGHWCLPVFFRCMMMGCSRFPPSCSGTPATSVCCSSPGLRSLLRPRSAASWAPRIGRRTETGTYFNNTLTRQNDPKQLENRCRNTRSLRYLLFWRWFKESMKAWPRCIDAVYLQCSSDHPIIWPVSVASKHRRGRCYSMNTPPRHCNQRQSPLIP